jgi:hypothetical protein
MALLFTQVLLVSIGRARTHRKLGTFGIGYRILIIFIGLSVGFAAPLHHIAEADRGQPSWFVVPRPDHEAGSRS